MKRKILVVEDEKLFAQLLKDALEALNGVTVDVVSNGAEGLEAVSKANYDLVFTDIHMPQMNGDEFLKTLRRTDESLGIFVLTAHVQENYIRQFNHLGIEDFLDKSNCDLDELRLSVEDYFRRRDIELMSSSIL